MSSCIPRNGEMQDMNGKMWDDFMAKNSKKWNDFTARDDDCIAMNCETTAEQEW